MRVTWKPTELAVPVAVEIQSADDAFYLFYLDEAGVTLTDTWHQTLAQAKQQALDEFGISGDDWTTVD